MLAEEMAKAPAQLVSGRPARTSAVRGLEVDEMVGALNTGLGP